VSGIGSTALRSTRTQARPHQRRRCDDTDRQRDKSAAHVKRFVRNIRSKRVAVGDDRPFSQVYLFLQVPSPMGNSTALRRRYLRIFWCSTVRVAVCVHVVVVSRGTSFVPLALLLGDDSVDPATTARG
jgi:hypothetical protein